MKSLFIRNLIFTILQPGLIAGLNPYFLDRNPWHELFLNPFQVKLYVGGSIFLVGFIIMLRCIYQFATEGRGTISPVDPTKALVISGLYKFSRNPMYIGVMLMLIGESLSAGSNSLWIYSLCAFIGFNIFIVIHEEPRLRNYFGDPYLEYCKKVRRWL